MQLHGVQPLKALSRILILRNFHLFDNAAAHGLHQYFLFFMFAELFQTVSGGPVERERRVSILVFDSIFLE